MDYSQSILSESFEKNKYTRKEINFTLNDFQNFQKYLLSPLAYFGNFPVFESFAENLNESLILDCSFVDWDLNDYDANFLGKIIAIWNSDYYKCYTIRINEAERRFVPGFSAIIYVEDYMDTMLNKFNGGLSSQSVSGVRVLVHPSGTIPNMKKGVSISPGLETTIAIIGTVTNRLAKPYSNCTNKVYTFPNKSNMTIIHCGSLY